jgi:8-oxo-dGTP pyrophosphatase MutT (NUDIX family)
MIWPALAAARAGDATARLPFFIDGVVVGSVARAHLTALSAWSDLVQIDSQGVQMRVAEVKRHGALAAINTGLREQGLLRGWRDEIFAIVDPRSGQHLARTERAAARFWGTLTSGAHATGYVADAQGRPTHLWIAQRAFNKSTDPGQHDNLIGGGVAHGQTPLQALLREAWEEAGLTPTQMRTTTGRVIRTQRAVPEGWMWEDLHSFDVRLPAGLTPQNQDGEVLGFACLPVAEALALAAGPSMTVDASLVTLDFVLRHALLPADVAAPLAQQLDTLCLRA